MNKLDLNKIKITCQIATNQAALSGAHYDVIGFTEFGLVHWDPGGKCKIH